ncbi:MAG: DMT family transporter [Gaiellaceae bacterium]
MTRGYVPLLVILAAIWGSSYLFIKVAVRQLEPAPMIELRLVLAVAILVGYLVHSLGFRRALGELRAASRVGIVLGTVNAAIPFMLIAWGEKHVDSGVAAIANATVPIFVVLLALHYRPSESVRGLRLVGIALGFLGVAVLTGIDPRGGWSAVAGTLAVIVASVSYAAGNLYAQSHVSETTTGPVLAAASMTGALILLLPLGIVQAPDHLPGWKALGSVAALGILGTAVAQLFFYRLLRLFGAARASLVAFLLPGTALFYGVVLLGEPLTIPAVAGLGLILAGVAIGSGRLRGRPRAA